MKEFKIGDRVVDIDTSYTYGPGGVGTIIKRYGTSLWGIQFDNYKQYGSETDGHLRVLGQIKHANSYIIKEYLGVK